MNKSRELPEFNFFSIYQIFRELREKNARFYQKPSTF